MCVHAAAVQVNTTPIRRKLEPYVKFAHWALPVLLHAGVQLHVALVLLLAVRVRSTLAEAASCLNKVENDEEKDPIITLSLGET